MLHLRLGIAALLLGGALGCSRGEGQHAEEEPHAAKVKAVALQRKTLEQWTNLPGTSQPLLGRVAQITARVDGQVVAIFPIEGQQVAQDQVIVRLDDSLAQANYVKFQANIKKLEEQKKQADLALAQAKIGLENAQKLGALVSPPELEKASNAYKDAQAKEQAAVAEQKSAEAELRTAEVQLGFYKLKAPIAGRLGRVQAVIGQSLQIGTSVASVVALDEIDVLCFVAPGVAARLHANDIARAVRYEGMPLNKESSPNGKVVFVDVQGQTDTGMFGVKVRFPNHDLGLKANAVVQIQVRIARQEGVLAIPANALRPDTSPPTVILVDHEEKDGKTLLKARVLEAEVGIRDREQGLVELRGLKDPESEKSLPLRDDMQFVIEGGTGLENGDLVALEKEEKEKEKEK